MKAYEVIDSPEKWTQGYYATDANGKQTTSLSNDAICWCAIGALMKAYADDKDGNYALAFRKLNGAIRYDIINWNDAPGRTWEEVHGLLKELDI